MQSRTFWDNFACHLHVLMSKRGLLHYHGITEIGNYKQFLVLPTKYLVVLHSVIHFVIQPAGTSVPVSPPTSLAPFFASDVDALGASEHPVTLACVAKVWQRKQHTGCTTTDTVEKHFSAQIGSLSTFYSIQCCFLQYGSHDPGIHMG